MPKYKLTFDNREEMEVESPIELQELLENLSANEFTRTQKDEDGHEVWVNSQSVRKIEHWPDPPQVGDGVGPRRERRPRRSGSGSPT